MKVIKIVLTPICGIIGWTWECEEIIICNMIEEDDAVDLILKANEKAILED